MVLDAKTMIWAARHELDTAKLKKAKVPLYGKWYFPELPANVPLVNLESGERRSFGSHMLAGEVIWAPEEELRLANLLPADVTTAWDRDSAQASAPVSLAAAPVVPAPEPLLLMTRPPAGVGDREHEHPHETLALAVPAPPEPPTVMEEAAALGIHLPLASIAPFVLGIGFCLVLLGLIANPIILIVGLVWMLAGAVGWVRIGLLEYGAAHADAAHADLAEHV